MTPDEHNALFAIAAAIHVTTGNNVDAIAKAVPADLIARLDKIQAGCAGGGGTEPPEPAEPKNITLTIPSVPGTATGTIS